MPLCIVKCRKNCGKIWKAETPIRAEDSEKNHAQSIEIVIISPRARTLEREEKICRTCGKKTTRMMG